MPFPIAGPKIASKGAFSMPTTVTCARFAAATATSIPMKEEPITTTFFLTVSSEPRAAIQHKDRSQLPLHALNTAQMDAPASIRPASAALRMTKMLSSFEPSTGMRLGVAPVATMSCS